MIKAKFRTITADLAERIHRGEFPAGARLPAERSLATQLGVNRSTVVAAYDELMSMGLVSREQGSGTFVRGDLWGLTPDWQRYISGAAFGPTLPLLRQVRQARSSPHCIDLSEGVLGDDLMPIALMKEHLNQIAMDDGLGYPTALGDRRLREVVAGRLSRSGMEADPDSILITSGTQQSIYLIIRALLSPGDAIAIERPSYYYALSVFQSAGIRLFPVSVDDQGLDPKQIRRLYEQHRIRLVIVTPTYQNPTGTTLSEARRQELLEVCRALNIPLVEDDVFCDLTLSEAAGPSPLKARDREGRVLYLGSTSKTMSPALRVGWMVGPRPVLERLAEVKHQMDFGSSVIPQRLAASVMATAAWSEHLHRLRVELRARRDALVSALREQFGDSVALHVPSGGLHLWTSWRDRLSDRQRLDLSIASGVILAPGQVYGAADGHARFSFSKANAQQIRAAVQRLADRTHH